MTGYPTGSSFNVSDEPWFTIRLASQYNGPGRDPFPYNQKLILIDACITRGERVAVTAPKRLLVCS